MNITQEGNQSSRIPKARLAAAIYAMGQDALWIHRQLLEGNEPDFSKLGQSMKLVEQEIIQLDH